MSAFSLCRFGTVWKIDYKAMHNDSEYQTIPSVQLSASMSHWVDSSHIHKVLCALLFLLKRPHFSTIMCCLFLTFERALLHLMTFFSPALPAQAGETHAKVCILWFAVFRAMIDGYILRNNTPAPSILNSSASGYYSRSKHAN